MLKIAGLLGLCIATMPMAYAIGNGNIGGDSSGGPGGSATPVPPPPVGSGQTAGGGGGNPPFSSGQIVGSNGQNMPNPVNNINGLDAKIKANTQSINENKLLIGQAEAKVKKSSLKLLTIQIESIMSLRIIRVMQAILRITQRKLRQTKKALQKIKN